ncbi:MAG TPA: energy transducer TonB [Thermoanaerobaculia bacterium]
MRKLASLLLLLFAASAFAASEKQTLGAHSAHHELRLERSVVAADQIAYDVVVVDLDTGKTVVSSTVNGKPGQPVEATGAADGKQIRVRLAYTPHFFSATVNVIDGKTIVDEFRTWWQLESHDVSQTATAAGLNAPGALRVGGDVKAPIVIRGVNPVYPDDERRNHVSGIVILEALIGKDGRVKDAAVLKTVSAGLDQAALDAVRQWEFKPGTLNGEPVDVLFNLTVSFRLDSKDES